MPYVSPAVPNVMYCDERRVVAAMKFPLWKIAQHSSPVAQNGKDDKELKHHRLVEKEIGDKRKAL